MTCEIKVVSSPFRLRYLLTMCIHLLSVGKLHFSGPCTVGTFQHRRMICEIKVVCSLFHLWYFLTMFICLFSGGKLLFVGLCMVSIATQENDL